MARESIEYDVVVVGGGPAGLSAAIRLKQLAGAMGLEVSVCLIDKAAEIGGQILSGAVMDTRALDELLPDWQRSGAPIDLAVSEERFLWLSGQSGIEIPHFLLPKCFHNRGNYVVSLGRVCRWLATQAEAMGVEIYPGFAGAEVLFDPNGAVRGVATGDVGRRRDGSEGPNFEPGMALCGKYTFFAEGSRGHLGKQLIGHFKLGEGAAPQTYGLGIKEVWQVEPQQHRPGLVVHTCGWPLESETSGGGFLYHLDEHQVAVGLVVGLGYRNPYLSPFEEFQRFKTHPAIRGVLAGGRRIAYGANSVVSGGLQALPRLVFPGGVLVGDDAGFLHAARSKGTHGAIKSGMLAAEDCFRALTAGRQADELVGYPDAFRASWLHDELWVTRNFKPWLDKGLFAGGLMFGAEQKLLGGKAPWTLRTRQPDCAKLRLAADCKPIDYPRPDGVLSFDRASSLFLANLRYADDQPCHLRLRDDGVPIDVNLAKYDAPEQRYCPAGVYEILCEGVDESPRLQINAHNCLHCKTCDIKDPTRNIDGVAPQGGDGPAYGAM